MHIFYNSRHEFKKLFDGNVSYPARCICLIIVLSAVVACQKDATPESSFTVQGKVIHHATRAGIAGVNVYVHYGQPCCGGIALVLGGDSTKTDAQGNYSIKIDYPKDTLLYRFMTYLKSATLVNKYYYSPFSEILEYGVVEFEYDQMAAPPLTTKLPDPYTQQCNFSVMPVGVLDISFVEKSAPDGDTVSLSFKRLDSGEVYKSFVSSQNLPQSRFPIPILEGIPTEINQIVTNAGGYMRVKKDMITMNRGERRNWVVEH